MKLKHKILSLCLGALLVLSSCETMELDLTENPNALSPSQADATFFLNKIQVDFAFWVHSMGDRAGELTRINYMNGRTYDNVYSPGSWDGIWSSAYRGMLEDIRLMNALAAESGGLQYHTGMGKVIEAYIMVTLVDFFGDVPYTEALKGGEGNLNPIADSGESIYAAAHALLDSAIADFNSGASAPDNDFYYNGDSAGWIKAANSIKKKMYINTGDYGAYSAIGNYIDSAAYDFQFTWGSNPATPDTRHPLYRSSYTSTGGGEYMSNWLMFKMLNSYDGPDLRLLWMFYRQTDATPGFDSPANEEVLECGLPGYFVPLQLQADNQPFCAPTNSVSFPSIGFWGRDHGNDNGIPPDGFLRTLRGVYPAGGVFDDNSFEGQVAGAGEGGEGITPIMLSSWMHFLNAEVEVYTGGDPTSETVAAITAAWEKVDDLGGPDASAEIPDFVTAFANVWGTEDLDGKLEMWATEFFIASTGNGIEAYNSYRRNGYPKEIQPNVEPDPGAFPVTQYYPANYTTNNSNAEQKSDKTGRVFWNVNGATNLK